VRLVPLFVCLAGCGPSATSPTLLVPHIVGDPWQVAGVPDLGMYNAPGQQPVDFAVWRAMDGTWQLQSCIRYTACGGGTRLFYRWEGASLTDTNWMPVGIAMQGDPSVGEPVGGLQAPHVLSVGSTYHMVYGDFTDICHATSSDGKSFTRVLGPDGRVGMFNDSDGDPAAGTRDPMILPDGDHLIVYDTASPNLTGADYAHTTTDFSTFGPSTMVARGGSTGSGGASAECPFVVSLKGMYYLFRTQRYGADAQTTVYRSPDPMSFGIDDDSYEIETLPVAAPEIVHDGDDWYIAYLLPSLQGIQLAKLAWDPQ
jgi:hypothetical protein